MKRRSTITQREIQRQLAAMREEVAAPRDFRAKILGRLAVEAGQGAPAPSASAWSRLAAFLSRPALLPAAAASLALAFGLWIALRPGAIQAPPPSASAVEAPAQSAGSPAAVPAPAAPRHPLQAKAAKLKAAVQTARLAEPLPPTLIQGSRVSEPAAAAGGAAASATPSQGKFSGSNAPGASPAPAFGGSDAGQGGPGASGGGVGPGPSPTPESGELQGSSQVRRNKFLPGKGEYAAILFRLKAPGHVHIEAYDRNGRIIAQIHDGDHGAGVFEIDWYGHEDDGSVAPTGIYLVRISTGEYDDRHKVVVVR